MRKHSKVFVSYSRDDGKWLQELRPYLDFSRSKYGIEYWDDRQIDYGVRDGPGSLDRLRYK